MGIHQRISKWSMRMNAIDQTAEPKLAEPGAGLPLMEWFVAKHVIIPLRFHFTTVAQGIEQFEHESNQILAIAKSLSEQNLCQRRLVPRLRGLEDSSRYWSVAMAIEHLVIVGNGMSNIITSLSKEISELPVSKIENVKPS